jgi:hypothetical protein
MSKYLAYRLNRKAELIADDADKAVNPNPLVVGQQRNDWTGLSDHRCIARTDEANE